MDVTEHQMGEPAAFVGALLGGIVFQGGVGGRAWLFEQLLRHRTQVGGGNEGAMQLLLVRWSNRASALGFRSLAVSCTLVGGSRRRLREDGERRKAGDQKPAKRKATKHRGRCPKNSAHL